MVIYREETFGPIAPVIVFDDEDEVVAMANDTTYGLASYVYTRDIGRAIRMAEALDFGIIGINDINPTSAAVPFGGIKESGLGREGCPGGHQRVPRHQGVRHRPLIRRGEPAPVVGLSPQGTESSGRYDSRAGATVRSCGGCERLR